MRRAEVGVAAGAQITPALVIGEKNHYIGLARLGAGRDVQDRKNRGNQREQLFERIWWRCHSCLRAKRLIRQRLKVASACLLSSALCAPPWPNLARQELRE